MSDPFDNDESAPDEALIGPGSTATGGGTAQDATAAKGSEASEADGSDHIKPLDPGDADSTQLADDHFQHPGL